MRCIFCGVPAVLDPVGLNAMHASADPHAYASPQANAASSMPPATRRAALAIGASAMLMGTLPGKADAGLDSYDASGKGIGGSIRHRAAAMPAMPDLR